MPRSSSSAATPANTTPKPRARRAFHNKVRTGCKTCKIRRVRCDEQRPACDRCTSTGRKCDGYPTDPSYHTSYTGGYSSSSSSQSLPTRSSNTPSPPYTGVVARAGGSPDSFLNAAADVQLQFLRSDPNQIRSFRYFLKVAAPAISGSFNAPFWTEEIPRACHDDPAIWHAIVSLGSVYEDHVALAATDKATQPYRNVFALEQFNKSVKSLITPGPQSLKDKWRAIIASVVFTAVCMVEGLYEQARVHFQAGCKLIQEIEAEQQHLSGSAHAITGPAPDPTQAKVINSQGMVAPTPVSVTAIRGVMIGLELWLQGMSNCGKLSLPTMMHPDDGVWYLWERYRAPARRNPEDRVLNKENLTAAKRAVESLLIANVVFSQVNAKEMERLFIERTLELVYSLAALQKPHVRSFKELHKAMVMFGQELDVYTLTTEEEPLEVSDLRLSYYFLSLYLATTRAFLVPPLHDYPLQAGMRDFTEAFPTAVDLAEKIIDLEAELKMKSRQALIGPNPPLSTPMSVATVVAPTSDVRRRAIKILQRPRIEGFLDGNPMASLSQAILAAEAGNDKEHHKQIAMTGSDTDPYLKGYTPGQDDEVHPLSRSYASGFESSRRGEGIVYVRTWRDHINGKKGKRVRITW